MVQIVHITLVRECWRWKTAHIKNESINQKKRAWRWCNVLTMYNTSVAAATAVAPTTTTMTTEKKMVCHVFIGSLFISQINPFSPCSLCFCCCCCIRCKITIYYCTWVCCVYFLNWNLFFINRKRKRITNKLDGLLLQYFLLCYCIIQCDIYMRISISLAHTYIRIIFCV